MSHPLNIQRGFSLPEVLVAMVLMVIIVTALSGYQRVLMHSFALRYQYLQIWRQAWQQTALYPFSPANDWKANRMQTTQSGCVSISVTMVSPSGRQGQMTRLHCPNR
ncbi:prepilin-type N-terminal cleavage/methylation domain-containing protein [Salmonella enterica]|nr:prepilin-type N-terminal cleavage/methylation domain-containing protein [Salmonella enterica]EKA4601452.1 prepilin-type N-terminal cleavage/methylation domain-containing protein [Salmonella enterica]ELL0184414.1 prepilin-type N-terminal cleavage/methylation domain-containing protein [Salmonella enterica]